MCENVDYIFLKLKVEKIVTLTSFDGLLCHQGLVFTWHKITVIFRKIIFDGFFIAIQAIAMV